MSSNAVKSAEQKFAQMGATVLLARLVKSSRKGSSRVVVICDCCVGLVNPKKQEKVEGIVYYADLESVSYENDILILKGQTTISFYTEEQEIRQAIGSAIQRQTGSKASTKLGVEELTSKKYSLCKRGIFARFMGNTIHQSLDLPHKTKQYVTEWISSGVPNISIDESTGMEKHMPSFLKAIEVAKWVSSLELPRMNEYDVYDLAARYMKERTHIKHIYIQGQATNKFHDFCLAIEDNNHSYLSAITVKDAQLTSEKLADLKTACVTRKVNSLGLIRSIKPSNVQMMFTELLTPNITADLAVLTLDGHPGLDFVKLMSVIENVEVLSIANCDLELSNVFPELANHPLHLKFLNLSGNVCTEMPDVQSVELPHSLRRIDLARIDWGDDCLSMLVKDLLAKDWENGLSLSLSEIRCSKDEWRRLRAVFGDVKNKTPLTRLSWNHNPLSAEFIRFLKKCKNLRALYMNNCKKFGEYVNEFSAFVETAPQLHALYLDSVGVEVCEIFEKIGDCVLEVLDVRNNGISDDELFDLVSLVQHNNTINKIAFDGSGVSSINTFAEMARKLKHAKRTIYTDFPSKDLNKMRTSAENVSELRDLFCGVMGFEEDVWIEPFHIFRLQNDDSFPVYLSDAVDAALKETIRISKDKPDKMSRTQSMQYSVRNKVNDGGKLKAYKKPIWRFPFQSVEEIDVSGIVEDYQDQFSLRNLGSALTNEKK